MRLAMAWLIADSVNAMEMASPARWRSPVGNPLGVGADVAVEFADRLKQSGLGRAGLGDAEIGQDVVDGL
jgi:hypothetical protein